MRIYIKRVVGAEGIYTKPLNLTLVPFPEVGVALQYFSELCMDFRWNFAYADMHFISIRQAIVYYKVVDAPLCEDKKRLWINQIMAGSDLQKIYAECITYQAWESVKFYRVKDIVRVRLYQIPDAKEKLFSTKPHTLLNAQHRDNEWGVGEIWNVVRWLKASEIGGRNYLGLAYKEVRDECQ